MRLNNLANLVKERSYVPNIELNLTIALSCPMKILISLFEF